jgi:hypothetical protein
MPKWFLERPFRGPPVSSLLCCKPDIPPNDLNGGDALADPLDPFDILRTGAWSGRNQKQSAYQADTTAATSTLVSVLVHGRVLAWLELDRRGEDAEHPALVRILRYGGYATDRRPAAGCME